MAQQITKQTLIGKMLQMDMGIAAILMAAGMHCVGCPSSAMESLEEACMVHGMDADQVLKRVNDYLANKDKSFLICRRQETELRKINKAYLWPGSKVWMRALKRTFKPPRRKSQICFIYPSEFVYL